MSPPNTLNSLCRELCELGLSAGMTVMVHSSLGQVGWTVGGPVTVIRALLEAIGAAGTLVMRRVPFARVGVGRAELNPAAPAAGVVAALRAQRGARPRKNQSRSRGLR